jgi:subtilisin family serine protease
MIDSSVEANLPTLLSQKLHQQSFVASGEASPDTRHGTAIASLLIGQGGGASHPHWQGLLPSADLYAAGVFQRWGARSMASAVAIAEALDWMAANHVSVINISLSGEPNLLMAAAVRHAATRGGVMVAAAGNGGPTAPPAYPGAYRDVIAVTAVDQNGTVFRDANHGDYIDFAAPGVRIWAPGGGSFGQYLTGTSFAAPYVTAAAALAVADASAAEPVVLRQQLAAHTLHLGSAGKNPIYGYGLLKATSSCDTSSASAL